MARVSTPYRSEVCRVEKPWGYEIHWALGERYCGKVLAVRAGEEMSLQYHERKEETLHLHEGRARIRVGPSVDELAESVLEAGMSLHLPPGTVHHIRALEDCIFLEVSTPELDDVVRLEDRYGRTQARR
jgi:mannose-6-phosphate isomerase-like protein (cupin superfamily)